MGTQVHGHPGAWAPRHPGSLPVHATSGSPSQHSLSISRCRQRCDAAGQLCQWRRVVCGCGVVEGAACASLGKGVDEGPAAAPSSFSQNGACRSRRVPLVCTHQMVPSAAPTSRLQPGQGTAAPMLLLHTGCMICNSSSRETHRKNSFMASSVVGCMLAGKEALAPVPPSVRR